MISRMKITLGEIVALAILSVLLIPAILFTWPIYLLDKASRRGIL